MSTTGIPSQYEKILIMARRVKYRIEKTLIFSKIDQKIIPSSITANHFRAIVSKNQE